MKVKKIVYTCFAIALIVISFLSGKLWAKGTGNFFKISLFEIISIILLIVVSYYLTQKKEDQRKYYEKTEELLNKITGITVDSRFTQIKTQEDIYYINSKHSRISNILGLLGELKISDKFTKDLMTIEHKLSTHRDFIGAHYNDPEHLRKCQEDFTAMIDVAHSKIDNCIVELYNKMFKINQ